MTDLFLPLPKLWLLKCLFSHWVETNVNRNQTYFNHYKSRIWESLWSAAWLWYCANITIRGIFLKKLKKKLRLNKEVQNLWTDEIMRDDRALTVWTLGQWNLLDSCAISAGKDLHLTLVLVELPIWPTNRIPIVTAIPVARAALKPLLLQTAKHIVALVRLHKTCRNRIFH